MLGGRISKDGLAPDPPFRVRDGTGRTAARLGSPRVREGSKGGRVSLAQVQGVAGGAVLLYAPPATTQQMGQDHAPAFGPSRVASSTTAARPHRGRSQQAPGDEAVAPPATRQEGRHEHRIAESRRPAGPPCPTVPESATGTGRTATRLGSPRVCEGSKGGRVSLAQVQGVAGSAVLLYAPPATTPQMGQDHAPPLAQAVSLPQRQPTDQSRTSRGSMRSGPATERRRQGATSSQGKYAGRSNRGANSRKKARWPSGPGWMASLMRGHSPFGSATG